MVEDKIKALVCTVMPKRVDGVVSFSWSRVVNDMDWVESLDELRSLIRTLGGEIVGEVVQKLEKPNPNYFVGSGKAREIKELITSLGANTVVFDTMLTQAQFRNLKELLGVEVMDREGLVIKIFSMRAKTLEGKLQVELASLKYSLSKLVGTWREMSRLGGMPGTRGPGEMKLEEKRRHLMDRIRNIERHLEKIRKTRAMHREARKNKGFAEFSLVGYTNAGKSTLIRTLTGAEVEVEDKLFSTLDPKVASLGKVLIADTVGFIRYLPHSLVEAFKATLEEVTFSDALIYVLDLTWNIEIQIQTIDSVLGEIGASGKPKILVFNKKDAVSEGVIKRVMKSFHDAVFISALNGDGIHRLRSKISSEAEAFVQAWLY